MIAVIDSHVSLVHLAQALACAGLEVTQTSEGAVISVSRDYTQYGYTSLGHIPALIRFEGVQHE